MKVDDLLEHLSSVGRSGKGWKARCPAHEDRHPSLSINEGEGGRVLLHCFAGCSIDSICCALGLEVRDLSGDSSIRTLPSVLGRGLLSSRSKQPYPSADAAITGALNATRRHDVASSWKLARQYPYSRADGTEHMRVLRFETEDGKRKTFRPIHQAGDGWFIGDPPGLLPLYGLQELGSAPRIFVCEGEKAVECARELGLVATTSAHGANAADGTDWSPLAGREVVILPDNDAGGRDYAKDLERLLTELEPPACVRVIPLPDLPAGGDIVEFVAKAKSDGASPTQVLAELDTYVAKVMACAAAGEERCPTYTPIDLAKLPEIFVSYVSVSARSLGCDSAYVALPLLAALASTIGHSRAIEVKPGWTEPAVLWAAIVGESGTMKSPAIDSALGSLKAIQHRAFQHHDEAMRDYKRQEREYEQRRKLALDDGSDFPEAQPEKPRLERFIVKDVTVEALALVLSENPRGVLLARDELSGWFAGFDRYARTKGGDAASWLEFHGARAIHIDRKTGDSRSIYVPRAAVSITGGIQPGVLARSLSSANLENGLAARFLMAMPPRKRRVWTNDALDEGIQKRLQALFEHLVKLPMARGEHGVAMPKLRRLSPAGMIAWIEFFNEHAQELAQAGGHEAAALAKLEGAAPRLALLIHEIRLAEDSATIANEDEVDEHSVEAAVSLVRWFRSELRRIYAMLNRDLTEDAVASLLHRVSVAGGEVGVREWQRSRSHESRDAAFQELQGLVDRGHGHWVSAPKKSRGRPGDPRFRLSREPGPPPRPEGDTSDSADRTDTDRIEDHSTSPSRGRPRPVTPAGLPIPPVEIEEPKLGGEDHG